VIRSFSWEWVDLKSTFGAFYLFQLSDWWILSTASRLMYSFSPPILLLNTIILKLI